MTFPPTSITYISTHANAFGRRPPYRQHVKHIAGTGNWTLCGRRLSDPYRISNVAEHALCRTCEARKPYKR